MSIYMIIFILLLLILCYVFFKEYKEKYTAIIIEPREHPALEFVLENFLSNLDNKWNFIIFHGNNNKKYVYEIINNKLFKYKNKITMINLNVDNLSLQDYNNLLVSRDFYKNIPTDVFLIFQTDTIICSDYKDLINDYIKYDYVGAPWKTNQKIGNGGLSLRRKSKMLEIIDNCKYDDKPEDVYFTLSCPNINRNVPLFEDAKRFSIETVYNDISFGVHKPWIHLKKNLINEKNNYCYGLNELIKLNKINKIKK